MKSAAVPADESERVAKLNAYKILDTLPETVYDDVVKLASEICGTPIALVSLVDTHRQWFKAKVGLDAPETPREVAFCAHAIHGDDVFEIGDAREDDRFHDNPLVTDEPHVIFYAGAPIVTPEGHKVGTLCVIDNAPNALSATQRDMLTRLSRQVAHILEQRIVSDALEHSNDQLRAANDELSQFTYRASHDLKAPLVSIRRLAEFVLQDLDDQQVDEAANNVKRISASAARLEGVVSGVLALHRASGAVDISEEFSILELVQGVKEDLHWMLEESGCEVISEIGGDAIVHHQRIRIHQIVENLVSNAIKYRDPAKESCFVKLKITQSADRLDIEVADNGVGIEEQFHPQVMGMFKRFHADAAEGSGLGLAIVKRHVESLQGSIEFVSSPIEGTRFSISIPLGSGE